MKWKKPIASGMNTCCMIIEANQVRPGMLIRFRDKRTALVIAVDDDLGIVTCFMSDGTLYYADAYHDDHFKLA